MTLPLPTKKRRKESLSAGGNEMEGTLVREGEREREGGRGRGGRAEVDTSGAAAATAAVAAT